MAGCEYCEAETLEQVFPRAVHRQSSFCLVLLKYFKFLKKKKVSFWPCRKTKDDFCVISPYAAEKVASLGNMTALLCSEISGECG